MSFCPKCGTQLDGTLKFCTACGTALAAGAAQPPVQQQQQPYMQPQQYQQPYAPAPTPAPAKKKSKAPLLIIAVIVLGGLVAAGIFTKGFGLFGGGSKGGAITVYGITGNNAALAQSGKQEQAAAPGAELTAGSRLATGAATSVYLKVAEDSILKMDEYSEISVSEISGGILKFDLVKGSVLVNENGPEGRVQMTAGNSLLIVRGTFFTAKYDGGDMVVDLIEGEIDVKTDSGELTNVGQGKRVTVRGDSDAEVDALDVSLFDAFTMGSVMEYKNVLTDGSLSETDFSYISDRLGNSETGSPIYDGGAIPEVPEATTYVWAADSDDGGGSGGGGEDGGGNGGGGSDGGGGSGDGGSDGGGSGRDTMPAPPEDWPGHGAWLG